MLHPAPRLTPQQLATMDLRSLSDARLMEYAIAFPLRHKVWQAEYHRRGLTHARNCLAHA